MNSEHQPLRILNVLGQKPGHTGSGILVQELKKCAKTRGDEFRLICAADNDDMRAGAETSFVTFDRFGQSMSLRFPIPGMSDVMPYQTVRYSNLSQRQVAEMILSYKDLLVEVVKDFRPHILHIHHLWVLLSLAEMVAGIPTFVTVHGTDLKQAVLAPKHRSFVAPFIGMIHRFICVSRDVQLDCLAEYKIEENRTTVIGNGYDPRVFNVDLSVPKPTRKVVLCVGKFVAWKGFHFAIRACAHVKSDIQLVIIGAGGTTETENLKNEALQLGVNAIFPGQLSHAEVAKWMNMSEVFVLPSLREPFGMALLEAMACGCRVVASVTGGPKDIIAEDMISLGYASFVDPPNEIESQDFSSFILQLSSSIEFHLSKGTTIADRIAISNSVSDHTWSNVYEKVRAKYSMSLVDFRENMDLPT